jgi:hypothetical protein
MNLLFTSFFFILSIYSQHDVKIIDFTPNIDGKIEINWENHVTIDLFKQYSPNLNEASAAKTIVYFTYDNENIYIAARLYQDKTTIQSNRYRRDTDELFSGDWFQMNYDPLFKGFNGYYLAINPSNSVIDGKIATSGQENKSWDGIFYSAVQVYDNRWEIEIKLPLNSIDFQTEDKQSWYATFARYYTPNNERSAAHNMLEQDLFRVSSYLQFNNLMNLRKSEQFQLKPFLLASFIDDTHNNIQTDIEEFGIDIKYNPSSATTVLTTINPDFAQLETDEEIINVSDSPTQFPEKRPFFTNNSDMYNPAPAVYTRNIGDIDFGLKVIHEFDDLKFDLTGIVSDSNKWYLGDFRLSDITNYKAEVIGGWKNNGTENLYNAVFNGEYYFFDKRLQFFTFQELNHVKKDHYGTLTGFRYRDRNWNGNIQYHKKEKDIDTRYIGRFILSNQSNYSFNGQHNWIFTDHFLRQISLGFNLSYNTLASDKNAISKDYQFWVNTNYFMNSDLGTWSTYLQYRPYKNRKFRYRYENGRYVDNVDWTYNTFDLVEMGKTSYEFRLNTDRGKTVSLRLNYNTHPIRQSNARFFSGNIVIKPISDVRIDYSYNSQNISGSVYQNKRSDIIHRFRLEYNVIEGMNLRFIYQKISLDIPFGIEYQDDEITPTGKIGYELIQPTFNFTGSWEYETGSFAYLVFNKFDKKEGYESIPVAEDFYSITFKINKSFHF